MLLNKAATRIARTILVIVLANLSACASTGTDRNSGTPAIQVPEPPKQSPPETPGTQSKQITADEELRTRAVSAIDAKEFDQASRLLERALRINSRSAANYYQFARLRDAQGLYAEALQFTEKGLTLASQPKLKEQLLTLRATVKQKLVLPKES